LGRIESLPLDDELADVVISNCVINLVPDKKRAFAEIYRILKPGGRLAISDIAVKKVLPSELKQSVEAFVGCIAGAQLVDEMERDIREAGFEKVWKENLFFFPSPSPSSSPFPYSY
jgi:arsenite methyltransferase